MLNPYHECRLYSSELRSQHVTHFIVLDPATTNVEMACGLEIQIPSFLSDIYAAMMGEHIMMRFCSPTYKIVEPEAAATVDQIPIFRFAMVQGSSGVAHAQRRSHGMSFPRCNIRDMPILYRFSLPPGVMPDLQNSIPTSRYGGGKDPKIGAPTWRACNYYHKHNRPR
ncbi:hypothetical protein BD779DRAFT_790501 [Infundibulicybe gibba]|nr:hypothetical protein BD779DRAFT_790501 [Infundibulicybe gibba]